MAYDGNYSEHINSQMQVPQTITVLADGEVDAFQYRPDSVQNLARYMEVPDRIVVSVGEKGTHLGSGEPYIQAEHFPEQLVALETPPRVLTLQDRHFGGRDEDTPPQHEDETANVVESAANAELEKSFDNSDEESDEISLMQRQMIKMHWRLSELEHKEKNRLQRDYWVCGIALSMLLINAFVLWRS